MDSLFEKLKRRKLIQWGLAYVTAAWLVAQILEVVEGPWNIPAAWVRASHIVLAGGLPVTLIAAWYHGERGRQRVSGAEVLAIAAVLFLAGLGVTFLGSVDSRISTETGERIEAQAERALLSVAAGLPRLAVLAFTNLGQSEDSFFADGITDELNSRLSGLKGLAVISRSSASMYRDSGKTPREIGEALGADYILNGTVRWSGSGEGANVRVIPELVRVADDTQVWSHQFDRHFERAFRIQAEIAGEVVAALDVAMSVDEKSRIVDPPTSNPLAYEAYLKGIQTLPDGHGPEEDYRQSRLLFEQAIRLDPGFALAWIGLAGADMGLYWFGYDGAPSRLDQARSSIDRALRLAPESAEASTALGEYYYRLRDYDRALEEFSNVFAQRPNDSQVIQRLGYLWRRQGLFEQGIESLERGASLDPLNAYNWMEVAWTHLLLGDFDRALELHARAMEIDPREEWNYLLGAIIYWARAEEGDLARARAELEAFPDPRSAYPVYLWFLQYLYEGNFEAALSLARNVPEDVVLMQATYQPVTLLEGLVLYLMGRVDEAKAPLTEAATHLEKQLAAEPADFRLYMALSQAYAMLGRNQDAVATAQRGSELMPVERDALVGSDVLYELLRTYALAGEDELALDTMAYMLARPSTHRGLMLTAQPEFRRLAENPRFAEILRQRR